MRQVDFAFDFTCPACSNYMGVTLRCSGSGLASGKNAMASVKVPCPTCQQINKLYFSADGVLHEVEVDGIHVPEPSFN